MKLSKLQQEFAVTMAEFIIWINLHTEYSVTLGEAWRSPQEQARLWHRGKTSVRVSQHQKRLAVDFNLFVNGKYTINKKHYRVLGEKWESMHPKARSGIRFGVKPENYDKEIGWDAGHVEFRG